MHAAEAIVYFSYVCGMCVFGIKTMRRGFVIVVWDPHGIKV